MNYGYQYPSAIIITDTNAHTGRFGKIHALNGSVEIATLVAENITENGSTTINSITVKQGSEIEGVMTSITLTSGMVIAYYL